MLAHALTNLGQALRHLGETDAALAHYEQGVALFQDQGDGWGIAYATNNLAFLLQEQGQWERSAALAAESVRRLRELGDTSYLVSAIEDLARALGGGRRPEAAARLFAAAQALRGAHGVTLPPGGQADYERHVARVRAALGAARFAAAWAEGEAMPLDQTLEAALVSDSARPAHTPARPRPASDVLTRREREVAALLARGCTNRQIAQALVIAEGTVGVHVEHILAKLGLYSRRQVAEWAAAHGLSDPQSN
jgi:non-specific serine/threonine protein kinase